MGLLKRKIQVPEASRFDRFDETTLYIVAEQALMTAGRHLDNAANDPTKVADLDYCDTALSDAQAAVRAALRRRLAMAQNL